MRGFVFQKMKKTLAVILFICISAIGVYFYFNSNQEKEQAINIQTLFSKWDKGEVKDSEKADIMNALAESVSKNPQITIKEIEALSNYISVFEADNLRVIQYIENPEFYGSSGRESYHVVVHNNQTKMLGSKGSMRIEEIIKRDEHLYYVYATDYRVSNITGIQIFSIELDGRTLNRHSLFNKEVLAEKFVYDDKSEILYYENGHVYFKEIRDKGNNILIFAGDTDFIMQLSEDGFYLVTPVFEKITE
ncbi:hypothetical protein V1L65_14245 [Paenibacillus sp. IITD108]